MKTPSRFMPKYVRPRTNPLAWVFLLAVCAAFLYLVLLHPIASFLVALGLGVFVAIERRRSVAKLRTLSDSRRRESICQFARNFDRRTVDSWVIRAVYEQLQENIGAEVRIPVRASDTFEDLSIDSEDLDMGIALEISQRTGRLLDHANRNPYYGRVKTAADLVLFFNAQPKAI